MRHPTMAISGNDLLNAIDSHTDTPWHDVIGCYEEEKSIVLDSWFVVSWPDHVVYPLYNSDAHYCMMNETDARNESDLVYGG